MSRKAHYPYMAPIDAYGNGGFRFAEMSHIGSLLCIPSGIYGWPFSNTSELTVESFQAVFAEAEQIEFLLMGTGEQQIFLSPEIRKAFAEAKIGFDMMSTGAACRTYNVLLAEKRAVAAALLAVT